MTFRFKNADVKMLAAEDDFELDGHKFRAGAFIIPNAESRPTRGVDSRSGTFGMGRRRSTPTVKTHRLDVPRIGYIHAWQRTQDEGWVRAALDYYGVPYTYFADQLAARRQSSREVRRDHLSARRWELGSRI